MRVCGQSERRDAAVAARIAGAFEAAVGVAHDGAGVAHLVAERRDALDVVAGRRQHVTGRSSRR